MDNFEKIYSDYYDIVYKYILSLCKDKVWAEEITQESFFKVLKNIDKFRGDCKLSVWLCQIAKNTFLTEAKRRNKNTDFSLDNISDYKNIEENIIDKETSFYLHKLLHKMENPYKEVFWMRTFGDLSFSQIADIYNKTESWARVTYYRAKLKIKEDLK